VIAAPSRVTTKRNGPRIEMILNELRLNTEDTRKLAKQARERAVENVQDATRVVAQSTAL
jgi:hypothetical protein